MNETEFLKMATHVLEQIQDQVESQFDEVQGSINGNVLTLELDSGEQVVINIQTPMQEIWLASRLGGRHFRYVDGQWLDTRSQQELVDAVLQSIEMAVD